MITTSGMRKPNMKELKQGGPLVKAAESSAGIVGRECVVESAGNTARGDNSYTYAP